MNQNDWKQDPRLKQMPREKLDCLTEFADRISRLPKDQILPAFLGLQAEAARRGIRFTDEETELLVSVLSADMPPQDKKKLGALRSLANSLQASLRR